MITVGVVVEGKDDFDIIEASVHSELSKIGIFDSSFRRLQPEPDATGTIPAGGWTKVAAWLMDNSGNRIDTYFVPLFEGVAACDFIVVHIDGDVCGQCLTSANLAPLPQMPSIDELIDGVRRAIDVWLAPSPSRRRDFGYAVPVYKTENWIIASMANCSDVNASRKDAKIALGEKFDAKLYKSKAMMRKELAQGLRDNSEHVYRRSKSYRAFSGDVLSSNLASR